MLSTTEIEELLPRELVKGVEWVVSEKWIRRAEEQSWRRGDFFVHDLSRDIASDLLELVETGSVLAQLRFNELPTEGQRVYLIYSFIEPISVWGATALNLFYEMTVANPNFDDNEEEQIFEELASRIRNRVDCALVDYVSVDRSSCSSLELRSMLHADLSELPLTLESFVDTVVVKSKLLADVLGITAQQAADNLRVCF